MQNKNYSYNITITALMSSLALIFSYIEAVIPFNPGIPGVKLGIANIVTVIALYKLSIKHAKMVINAKKKAEAEKKAKLEAAKAAKAEKEATKA